MKKTLGRTPIRYAAAALGAAIVLAAFVAAQDPPPPPGRPGPRAARARAIAELKLTPDQVQALGEFRKARLGEKRAFREEMGRLRGEMRRLAGDPKADQAALDRLIDRRAKLRADLEKGALRARAERDKVFTPEQLEKIRAFRSERQERAGRTGGWRQGWRCGRVRGWRRW